MSSTGMALGMVMQLPEEADETSVSKRQLLAKLDVCMGGRVAEELIFGESDITTGASSDIEQVCSRSLSFSPEGILCLHFVASCIVLYW